MRITKLKPKEFSKLMIFAIVCTVLLYTLAVLYISYKGMTVPDSLTVAFFGFFGTELINMAVIKSKKIKHGSDCVDDTVK